MRRRPTSWRIPAVVVTLMAAVPAGYVYLPHVGWSNSQVDAQARAEAYLAAVMGGTEDRGWSLLEASGRNLYGSEESYRRLMSEADWSDFEWDLRYNGVCDDGICSFVVYLPNGKGSAPEEVWSSGLGDPGVLVDTYDATTEGQAFVGVRQRGWFGGIGVEVSEGTGSPG